MNAECRIQNAESSVSAQALACAEGNGKGDAYGICGVNSRKYRRAFALGILSPGDIIVARREAATPWRGVRNASFAIE